MHPQTKRVPPLTRKRQIWFQRRIRTAFIQQCWIWTGATDGRGFGGSANPRREEAAAREGAPNRLPCWPILNGTRWTTSGGHAITYCA